MEDEPHGWIWVLGEGSFELLHVFDKTFDVVVCSWNAIVAVAVKESRPIRVCLLAPFAQNGLCLDVVLAPGIQNPVLPGLAQLLKQALGAFLRLRRIGEENVPHAPDVLVETSDRAFPPLELLGE